MTPTPHADVSKIISKVLEERRRQNEKWGVQTNPPEVWQAILTEEVGESAQAVLHDIFGGRAAGTLETEVIHVAAVAFQWLEAIEREKNE